jgi:hypothetical protein
MAIQMSQVVSTGTVGISGLPQKKVIELPQTTKILPCGKCGRDLTVPTRTVLAYCQSCSANLGVKR